MSKQQSILSKQHSNASEWIGQLLSIPLGKLDWTQFNTWFYLRHSAKWHLDRFSRSCMAHERDKQTDGQTNKHTAGPRYSVCSNKPHLAIASMRRKNR